MRKSVKRGITTVCLKNTFPSVTTGQTKTMSDVCPKCGEEYEEVRKNMDMNAGPTDRYIHETKDFHGFTEIVKACYVTSDQ